MQMDLLYLVVPHFLYRQEPVYCNEPPHIKKNIYYNIYKKTTDIDNYLI